MILNKGNLYLDNKGTKIIYLGRGFYERIDDFCGWHCPKNNCYLYMKYDDIIKKISDGRLAQDFSKYKGRNGVDFFKTVFFSEKPRNLVQDLGPMYSPNTFIDLYVEDYTDTCNNDRPMCTWHVKTV